MWLLNILKIYIKKKRVAVLTFGTCSVCRKWMQILLTGLYSFLSLQINLHIQRYQKLRLKLWRFHKTKTTTKIRKQKHPSAKKVLLLYINLVAHLAQQWTSPSFFRQMVRTNRLVKSHPVFVVKSEQKSGFTRKHKTLLLSSIIWNFICANKSTHINKLQ